MARAGQQAREDEGGLEDRISVGVLARAFPRELVEEVIDAAGAREQRKRVLPAWLTLYFMLALALFMDRGAARVMRKLAGVLAWAERGVAVTVPSEEALSNARARLGAGPLRLLFEKVAGFVAPPGAPGRGGGGCGWCRWTARRWTPRMRRRTGSGSAGRRPGRRTAGGCGARSRRCGCWRWPSAGPGRWSPRSRRVQHRREDPGQGADRPARRGDAVPGGPELRLLGAVAGCGGDRGAAAVADRRVVHAARWMRSCPTGRTCRG